MDEATLRAARAVSRTADGAAVAPIEVLYALRSLIDPADVTASVAYQLAAEDGTRWEVTWVAGSHVAHAVASAAHTKDWDLSQSSRQKADKVEAAVWPLDAARALRVTSVAAYLDMQYWNAHATYAVDLSDGSRLHYPPLRGRLSSAPDDEAAGVLRAFRVVLGLDHGDPT